MLSTRIIAAIIMVIAIGGALCLDYFVLRGDELMILILLVILPLALNEFYQFAKAKGRQPLVAAGLLFAVLYLATNWLRLTERPLPWIGHWSFDGRGAVLFLFLGVCFFWQGKRKEIAGALDNIAVTVLGFLYVIVLGSYLMSLRHFGQGVPGVVWQQSGMFVLLSSIVVAKGTDIAAYFAGSHLGKHKILPVISPKKTWEGFFGGLAGGVLLGGLLCLTPWKFAPPWIGLLFGLAVSLAAQLGDWAESMLKRDANIKDSGHSIPGFGGVLDILDAILVAAPVAFYFLHFARLWT